MIKIAIFGYGTVGSGVACVIDENSDLIADRLGQEVCVKYILDLRDFPGDKHEKEVVHDIDIILNDPEVSICCETMGGVEPAFSFSKRALEAGKSVCTSNKELVEQKGLELMEIAHTNGVNYLFEASVGGGIPVIRTINEALCQDDILSIMGILNGTTNYILTAMDKNGVGYEEALKTAQELGYAERNPEADVEGHDAGRKIAILTSLISGKSASFSDVYMQGITRISTRDFEYAKSINKVIKLLAISQKVEDGYVAMVAPFMIGDQEPLAMVGDVFNAVMLTGNMVDRIMLYGRGAGKLATASAVVGDVIDLARAGSSTLPCNWKAKGCRILPKDDIVRDFYIRRADGEEIIKSISEKEFETTYGNDPRVLSYIRIL